MAADSWVAVAVESAPLVLGLVFTAAFLVAGVRLLRTGLGVAASDPIDASAVHHAEGVVEVEGAAEPAAETLTAPASDTECLGYVHEITNSAGDRDEPALIDNSDPSMAEDEHRGGSAVVERNRELAPFYVADATGRVLVGDDADLYLGEQERYPDEEEEDRAHLERRLEPGDEVHVYGQRQDVVEARADFPDERVYVGSGDEVDMKLTVGDEREVVLKRAALGGFLTLFAGGATLLLGRELLTVAGVL
jgi:hypothetical protein